MSALKSRRRGDDCPALSGVRADGARHSLRQIGDWWAARGARVETVEGVVCATFACGRRFEATHESVVLVLNGVGALGSSLEAQVMGEFGRMSGWSSVTISNDDDGMLGEIVKKLELVDADAIDEDKTGDFGGASLAEAAASIAVTMKKLKGADPADFLIAADAADAIVEGGGFAELVRACALAKVVLKENPELAKDAVAGERLVGWSERADAALKAAVVKGRVLR